MMTALMQFLQRFAEVFIPEEKEKEVCAHGAFTLATSRY